MPRNNYIEESQTSFKGFENGADVKKKRRFVIYEQDGNLLAALITEKKFIVEYKGTQPKYICYAEELSL